MSHTYVTLISNRYKGLAENQVCSPLLEQTVLSLWYEAVLSSMATEGAVR